MSKKSSPGSDVILAPSRLPLTSADPLAPHYEQLKALFPTAVTDGRADLEKLRTLMGEHAASGPERYGLSWAGKSDALKALRQLTTATLLPAPLESEKWDTTGHAIIEGDNLEVLKVLQRAYYGKVKLIYIDPPYNTGGDFIYPDNYTEGLASYLQFTRQVRADGAKLTTNVDSSGRYHSRWLTMMFPRLFLARNLLREDGVIFVSIDDHEVHNLRLILDEIFGEENFVAHVVWHKKRGKDNSADFFSKVHDHILCYSRVIQKLTFNRLALGEETRKAYRNADDDARGDYRVLGLWSRGGQGGSRYSFQTKEGVSFSEREWLVGLDKMKIYDAENRLIAVGDKLYRKFFLTENEGSIAETLWTDTSNNANAADELKVIFGDSPPFDTPKPVPLIERMLELATGSEDLILDFFAGSGTTAQAVLELNKKDGGSRKFILVQLPEPTGRKDFPTITEITKERVRRVIARMGREDAGKLALADGPRPDLGFKVFKLAPSNFAIWDPALAAADPGGLAAQWQLSADNVAADASEQALLHELMLKSSLPLTAPAQPADAAGTRVWLLDEGRLLICLARTLTREALRAMIALKPQSLLCLDVGFVGNDTLKVNAQLECQSHEIQFRTA